MPLYITDSAGANGPEEGGEDVVAALLLGAMRKGRAKLFSTMCQLTRYRCYYCRTALIHAFTSSLGSNAFSSPIH